MELEQVQVGNVLILRVSGRMILGNLPRMEEAAAEARLNGTNHFVLNLSGVTDITSSGIGLLLSLFNSSREAGGDLAIAEPSANCKRALDLARFDDIFHIFTSEDEAVESLKA